MRLMSVYSRAANWTSPTPVKRVCRPRCESWICAVYCASLLAVDSTAMNVALRNGSSYWSLSRAGLEIGTYVLYAISSPGYAHDGLPCNLTEVYSSTRVSGIDYTVVGLCPTSELTPWAELTSRSVFAHWGWRQWPTLATPCR